MTNWNYICECSDESCKAPLTHEQYNAAKERIADGERDKVAIIIPSHATGGEIIATGEGWALEKVKGEER